MACPHDAVATPAAMPAAWPCHTFRQPPAGDPARPATLVLSLDDFLSRRIPGGYVLGLNPAGADAVREFFAWGHFPGRRALETAIGNYLLTAAQAELSETYLFGFDELFDGRVAGTAARAAVRRIFREWNEWLGRDLFFL